MSKFKTKFSLNENKDMNLHILYLQHFILHYLFEKDIQLGIKTQHMEEIVRYEY
jgi:hypothetical protein